MNSKRKGSAGERELCALLQQAGLAHRNDQMYKGGVDNPDVSFQIGGQIFHVECKRPKSFPCMKRMSKLNMTQTGTLCLW